MSFVEVGKQGFSRNERIKSSVQIPLNSGAYHRPRKSESQKSAVIGFAFTTLSSLVICGYLLLGNILLQSNAPEASIETAPGTMQLSQIHRPIQDIRQNSEPGERIWNCGGRFTNDPSSGFCVEVTAGVGQSEESYSYKYFTPEWN